jgi:hypothetical protein
MEGHEPPETVDALRPAGLAWGLWALAILCLAPAFWLQHLLSQASRPPRLAHR